MPDRPADAAPPSPPRARPRLLPALIPALLIIAASFLHTELAHRSWDRLNAILSVWSPERSNIWDVQPALDAARTLLVTPDAPIYDMSQTDRAAFLYPPIAAAIYIPHVQRSDGAFWSLIAFNRAVYLIIALLLTAALIGPRRRWPRWPEALGVAASMITFLPLARALELNQASLYIAALIGGAWIALDRSKDTAAGVLIALAAAIKPHLFLAAPLLYFHARRAALAAAITAAVLGAASIAYAGLDNHITYLTHVLPEAARGYAFFPNQSIGGLLHRALTAAPLDAFELAAPNALITRTTLLTGLTLYALTLAILFRARRRPDLKREAFALAWLITTMIAPIAWGHHYAAALFPLAWLIGRARAGLERDGRRITAVAAGCALLGSYFVVSHLTGPAERLLASYGLFGAALAAGTFAVTLARAGTHEPAITAEAAAPSDRAPMPSR